ncbi:peroxiredoxin [Nonlabens dokdonensis]|uniref:Thioredoxin family protein n=2 Tax=Nonlabens dokdonensis TaxID=328515 RepID=L7WEQ7_NONDD|nr:redoxin family protein [Nonlabens dokdonensis]AGC77343.1 thioredoxin family protein [Nonlabens dokdonensis DSW-6]PZX40870.1 peroxiredoxin [Nonlabens dokdonensis]
MNKFTLLLIALLTTLLVSATRSQAEIKGTIKNSSFEEISVKSINNRLIEKTSINSNGDFKLKLTVDRGYYFLEYGRESFYIYLLPKDKLEVYFDANEMENTLTFKGERSQANTYLQQKSSIMEKMTEDVSTFYDVTENQYLKNIAAIKSRLQSEMNNYQLSKSFITDEEKSLQFNYLLSIQNYKSSYKYTLGKEVEPSDAFYSELASLDLRNMEDYKVQPYYYYLVNSIWSKRINAEDGFNNMEKKLFEIKDREVLNNTFNGFYSQITRDKAKAEDYFKLIEKYSSSKDFTKAAKKQLESLFLINKGDVSPGFTYKDINDKVVSLSDFKGKLVYIDVWATWCAPCKKQIPFLKKLEEEFAEENIVFISISVDAKKAYKSWKTMVKEEELGGVQLFADNSFDSEFAEAYGITSIPRFIIVDQEGKVYDDKAPSPSFEQTKALLQDLLK